MEHSQIHRVSVADQAAAILRQRILDGELRPGTPLQEVLLANSLGVSRNTMREAMRILSIEGLLKRSLHRGVAVSQLSLKDVQEIYRLRRMLEITAVLAANPGDHDILEADAKGRDDEQRKHDRGKAEHNVDHAGPDRIHRAAKESRRQAEERSHDRRERHRKQPDRHRDAGAMENPAEHVASVAVGSKKM